MQVSPSEAHTGVLPGYFRLVGRYRVGSPLAYLRVPRGSCQEFQKSAPPRGPANCLGQFKILTRPAFPVGPIPARSQTGLPQLFPTDTRSAHVSNFPGTSHGHSPPLLSILFSSRSIPETFFNFLHTRTHTYTLSEPQGKARRHALSRAGRGLSGRRNKQPSS